MTLIQSLRLLRPALRAPRALRASRFFHDGPPSGGNSGNKLQDPAAGRPKPLRKVGVAPFGKKQDVSTKESEDATGSEFKKMREKVLKEVVETGLYTETHPRLIHREKPTPVPRFKRKWGGSKLDDPRSNDEIVTLYGRIKSIRQHGNRLLFVNIVNEFETVQGMMDFRNMEGVNGLTYNQFKLFCRLIEKGDHISLTGKPTRTKAGSLSVVTCVLPELLAPTMEQIPYSLTDPETRAQKRHLDMIVNPHVADILRLRSYITKYIRDYLHEQDFLEFQTPILAENAGGAVARSFTTAATEFPSKELSLRIAPELWLKRLVVGGVHKVFEIGPAFRNEGIDLTHNPEFAICEFYSAYTTLPDLIRRTEQLLGGLARHCADLIVKQLTTLPLIDVAKFTGPYKQLEFVPALEDALGTRLPKLSGKNAYSELLAVLSLCGVEIPGGFPPTLPKLLDRLAAVYLEPKSFDGPLFITHHPACMSPLAKSFLCPKTFQLVSARTELFVNGRELANMYEEENNPAAQAQKLAEHRALGTGKKVEEVEPARDAPLDESYLKTLEAGLPPTGGWGCGVERLVMLFSGSNRINDCLSFGTLRNVVGLTSEGPQKPSESSE